MTANHAAALTPPLNDRERDILRLLYNDGMLGVTAISKYLDIPSSSTHKLLTKLEEAALVISDPNKKRRLTDLGMAVAQSL